MARKTRSDKGKSRKWAKGQSVTTFRNILVDRAKWFRGQGFKTQIRKTGRNHWTLFYRWGYGRSK